MRLTIDTISQILKVPASSINRALADLGIKPDENKTLSEKDVRKLRPVLLRYYGKRTFTESGESAGKNADSSEETSEDDIPKSVDDIPEPVNNVPESVDDIPEPVNNVPESVDDIPEPVNNVPESVDDIPEPVEDSPEPMDAFSESMDAFPESADALLEELVTDDMIMLDTCSIMHEGCQPFIDSIVPLLKKSNKKIIIPQKVIEELIRHQNNRSDPHKSALAEKGLQLCRKLKDENCLSVRGGQYDNFADNVFFVQFSNLRFRYNMVLITQDQKLSEDILQLNRMQIGGGKPVRVFKLSSQGFLIETEE